ncbi:MAG: MFS transporter [Actinobacteria bacterium]|nr:MAG: MFS transporter [Actinomycetota bacterium]
MPRRSHIAAVRTSRGVIGAYLTTNALFTLAASLIWGVNTLFLMGAGLDILQVMLVNTAFTVGQIIFEVPTGVVADTIGRKFSFLLGNLTLFVSTLLYVASAHFGWGFWAFVGASVIIGLGFTFQTGAVDAWLVDALEHTGYEGARERVFSWAGMLSGSTMLIGTLAGGFLGQIDLAWPYVVRAALLIGCFLAAALLMQDLGFAPRPLRLSRFGEETRTIFDAGVRYGWGNRVVRPLLLVSLVGGIFGMYGFYSWQRYALDLLGKEYIWVSGVLAAAAALASIIGNLMVSRIMRTGERRRKAWRVLAVCSALLAMFVAAIGVVGLFAKTPGVVPLLVASALWMGWGIVFGVVGPIRQAYLNEHVPSAQRATVLSLDAFFGDVGGAGGQPVLGWMAKTWSIPVSWLVGAVVMLLSVPLYRSAGGGEDAAEESEPAQQPR